MKTGDEVLADVRKLREEMCEFLMENRSANEAQGLPKVGPAARAIEKELQELLSGFQQVVRPETMEAVNWDRGMLGQ